MLIVWRTTVKCQVVVIRPSMKSNVISEQIGCNVCFGRTMINISLWHHVTQNKMPCFLFRT